MEVVRGLVADHLGKEWFLLIIYKEVSKLTSKFIRWSLFSWVGTRKRDHFISWNMCTGLRLKFLMLTACMCTFFLSTFKVMGSTAHRGCWARELFYYFLILSLLPLVMYGFLCKKFVQGSTYFVKLSLVLDLWLGRPTLFLYLGFGNLENSFAEQWVLLRLLISYLGTP